ncbi:helix-hairpin-helix domain-containing protein [Desulfonema magnum]
MGKKRKQTLLQHFGNIQNIRTATPEEISRLSGVNHKLAEAVKEKLKTEN